MIDYLQSALIEAAKKGDTKACIELSKLIDSCAAQEKAASSFKKFFEEGTSNADKGGAKACDQLSELNEKQETPKPASASKAAHNPFDPLLPGTKTVADFMQEIATSNKKSQIKAKGSAYWREEIAKNFLPWYLNTAYGKSKKVKSCQIYNWVENTYGDSFNEEDLRIPTGDKKDMVWRNRVSVAISSLRERGVLERIDSLRTSYVIKENMLNYLNRSKDW